MLLIFYENSQMLQDIIVILKNAYIIIKTRNIMEHYNIVFIWSEYNKNRIFLRIYRYFLISPTPGNKR